MRNIFKKTIFFVIAFLFVMVNSIEVVKAYIIDDTAPVVGIFIPEDVPTNDLVINKSIEHNMGSDYEVPNISFDFEVNFGKYYSNYTFNTSNGKVKANKNGVINVKVNSNSKITIKDIDVGTNVKITEKQNKPGFTVKGNATKNVTITKGDAVNVYYTNVYEFKGITGKSINVNGKANLTGYENQEDNIEFNIVLEQLDKDGNWVKLGTKTTNEGNFNFNNEMNNVMFDNVGTYVFRVSEVKGDNTNITYDSTINYFTVEITDKNMDGYLEIDKITGTNNATVSGNNVYVTFNNSYEEKEIDDVTVNIKANVDVINNGSETIGRDGFEFKLVGSGENLNTYSDSLGNGEFNITYTKNDIGKTYTYTLSEVNTGIDHLTYDTRTYTITITVGYDEATNKLVITKTIDGVNVSELLGLFVNTYDYTPEPVKPSSKKVKVNVNKKVNNVGNQSIGKENFRFELRDEASGRRYVSKTDKDGYAGFNIEFTEEHVGNTYSYKLYELNDAAAHVTYSNKVYDISIVVGLDSVNNAVTTDMYIDGKQSENIVGNFTNIYDYSIMPKNKSARVEVFNKVYDSKKRSLDSGGYQFIIQNISTGGSKTVTSDRNGYSKSLFNYTYNDIGKSFSYKVYEVKGSNSNITYSNKSYNIVVKVGYDANNNELLLEYYVDGIKVNNIKLLFENYSSSGEIHGEDENVPHTGVDGPVFRDIVEFIVLSSIGFIFVTYFTKRT